MTFSESNLSFRNAIHRELGIHYREIYDLPISHPTSDLCLLTLSSFFLQHSVLFRNDSEESLDKPSNFGARLFGFRDKADAASSPESFESARDGVSYMHETDKYNLSVSRDRLNGCVEWLWDVNVIQRRAITLEK